MNTTKPRSSWTLRWSAFPYSYSQQFQLGEEVKEELLAPVTAKRKRLASHRLGNTKDTTMDNHWGIWFLAKAGRSRLRSAHLVQFIPRRLSWPECAECHSSDIRNLYPLLQKCIWSNLCRHCGNEKQQQEVSNHGVVWG